MQYLLFGIALALAGYALRLVQKLTQQTAQLAERTSHLDRTLKAALRRQDLRHDESETRQTQLESRTRGNLGQLKYLLRRVQRIESFLRQSGYEPLPHGRAETVPAPPALHRQTGDRAKAQADAPTAPPTGDAAGATDAAAPQRPPALEGAPPPAASRADGDSAEDVWGLAN